MKYSKNQKAAKEFLKWVLSKEQFSKSRPGNEPGGLREVGGGRAQEDLRDVG